jgi:hypothetical protein
VADACDAHLFQFIVFQCYKRFSDNAMFCLLVSIAFSSLYLLTNL